jgi:cell division protease FtsH
MALGLTQTMPEEDRFNLTKEQIVAQIKHAMGGRAAEKLVFDYYSTGASNDLQQATAMARRMVCQYGMSDKLGPVAWGDSDHDVFLGRDFVQRKDYSEKKAEEIDEEVTQLLTDLYNEAVGLLRDHRQALDRISEALLERETLEGAELKLLLEGKPLPPLRAPAIPGESGETPPERAEAKPKKPKLPEPEPEPEPVPS